MKRISNYESIENGQVLLADGTRWTVAPGHHLDVVFWTHGDPVESEDCQPGGYLGRLGAQARIPAHRVDEAA